MKDWCSLTIMHTFRARVREGLKSVALWWVISALIATVIGALYLGKEAAVVNMVGTTIFAIFITLGVFIGARGPAESQTINMSSPKVPIEPSVDRPATQPVLKPYSAFIETRGRHGTIVIVGKSKESAKRQIIEMYPDCKIMFFDEWLRDRNFIVRGKLDD